MGFVICYLFKKKTYEKMAGMEKLEKTTPPPPSSYNYTLLFH
jgi:hypothetical protein